MRIFKPNKILWCGLFSGIEINELDLEKYKEARGLYIEDPWERVKTVFEKDGFGNWHPELIYAFQFAQMGAVAGFFYGGAISGYEGKRNHIRNTETEIFASRKEAFRGMVNHTVLAFGRGGLKWAPRFAFFCGSFTLFSSCCELYRNKTGIIENTLAGCLTGALCKFSFGIKGLISGGTVGGLLGTIYGVVLWSLQKLTKTNHIEIKYSQFAYMKYRERYLNSLHTASPEMHDMKHLHDDNPLNYLDIGEEKVNQSEEK